MRQTVRRMPPATEAQRIAVKKAIQKCYWAVRQDIFRRPRPLSGEERMRVLDATQGGAR